MDYFSGNNKLCVKLYKIGFHLHFLSQRTLRKVFQKRMILLAFILMRGNEHQNYFIFYV